MSWIRRNELSTESGRDLIPSSIFIFVLCFTLTICKKLGYIDSNELSILPFGYVVSALLLVSGILELPETKRMFGRYSGYTLDGTTLSIFAKSGAVSKYTLETLRQVSLDGRWLVFEDESVPVDNLGARRPTPLAAKVLNWIATHPNAEKLLEYKRMNSLVQKRATRSYPGDDIPHYRIQLYGQIFGLGFIATGFYVRFVWNETYYSTKFILIGICLSITSFVILEMLSHLSPKWLKAFDEKHPEVIAYIRENESQD